MSHSDDIKFLKELAHSIDPKLLNIACDVIDDHRFQHSTGSLDNKHHYGKHGLLRHTTEVVKLCFSTLEALGIKDVDPVELYLSALFHDVGKIMDYIPKDETMVEWEGTKHKRMIHHISGSAVIWTRTVIKYPHYSKYHDSVLHAILAHHGQREWGSPVAPYTKVAWLVHLCDGLSARMNDCDKIDYLKTKKE